MSSSAWTSDANEALSLSLGAFAVCDSSFAAFTPVFVQCVPQRIKLPCGQGKFTKVSIPHSPIRCAPPPFSLVLFPTRDSQIYGEEEKIYGYKELSIDVRLPPTLLFLALITSQLKFASGSLVQCLSVHHSEKLPASTAVDDVEDTLAKFLPEGYYTDEQEFLKRVEEDAINFKPAGEKIYSYSRAATTLPKGKNVAISQVLSPEDQETVDFEVYHVSSMLCSAACLFAPLAGAARTKQPEVGPPSHAQRPMGTLAWPPSSRETARGMQTSLWSRPAGLNERVRGLDGLSGTNGVPV